MSQDLRKLFEEERNRKFTMKAGHEERFTKKLHKALPLEKKRSWPIWAVAASIAVLISAGVFFYTSSEQDVELPIQVVNNNPGNNPDSGITMGDLSPDLKKVEDYYVSQINFELASLEVSGENKTVVDRFMEELNTLNKEYLILNKELNELGPNDQTLSALIKNLQLRLQLLHKLNTTLNELKSSKNEQATSKII